MQNSGLFLKMEERNYKVNLKPALVMYKIILDILYYGLISKKYGYYGFLGGFSIPWYIFSWILFIFFTLWITKLYNAKGHKISVKILFFLSMFSFFPFLSMIASDYDFIYKISNIIFWLILFICISSFSKIRSNGVHIKFNEKNFIHFILFFSIAIVMIIVVFYSNFRFTLNLIDVYGIRSDAASIDVPNILTYLFDWSRIVIPILITYFFIKKKYILYFILIIVQIYSYSFDGLKLVAFTTIVASGLPIIYRIFKDKIFKIIILSIVLINLYSIFEYFLFDNSFFLTTVSFRTLFLPNLIGTWFFDFFQTNIPDFFRSSFLRYIGVSSPYASIGIDYIISGLYFGNFAGRANNGLISDAMTNFGYIGIFIMPLLITIVLHLFDKCSTHVHEEILILVSIYYAYSFTNTFLPVILVTYGGIVVMFLLMSINFRRSDALCNIHKELSTINQKTVSSKKGYLYEKKQVI